MICSFKQYVTFFNIKDVPSQVHMEKAVMNHVQKTARNRDVTSLMEHV